jgi:hypothetical protein
MDKKTLDEIIGRAATDSEFRQKLIADPRKALAEAGYPQDENLLAVLDPAHLKELDALASDYENRFLGGKSIHEVVSGTPGGTGDSKDDSGESPVTATSGTQMG